MLIGNRSLLVLFMHAELAQGRHGPEHLIVNVHLGIRLASSNPQVGTCICREWMPYCKSRLDFF
jgi:hypothetical protein